MLTQASTYRCTNIGTAKKICSNRPALCCTVLITSRPDNGVVVGTMQGISGNKVKTLQIFIINNEPAVTA